MTERREAKFLLDENMPRRSVYDIKDAGGKAVHVLDIFSQGMSDRRLADYAEEHKMFVLTKDGKTFPELTRAGDRIVFKDIRGEMAIRKAIIVRLRGLDLISKNRKVRYI